MQLFQIFLTFLLDYFIDILFFLPLVSIPIHTLGTCFNTAITVIFLPSKSDQAIFVKNSIPPSHPIPFRIKGPQDLQSSLSNLSCPLIFCLLILSLLLSLPSQPPNTAAKVFLVSKTYQVNSETLHAVSPA